MAVYSGDVENMDGLSQNITLKDDEDDVEMSKLLMDEYLSISTEVDLNESLLHLKAQVPLTNKEKEILVARNCYRPQKTGKPVRVAFIINLEFADLPEGGNTCARKGSENDVQIMRHVAREFGYQIYAEQYIAQKEGQWSKNEILKLIEDFKRECVDVKVDSILVFIGGYGDYTRVLTCKEQWSWFSPFAFWNSDNRLNIREEILRAFYHDNCTFMKGKAKLFIFNTNKNDEQVISYKDNVQDALPILNSDLFAATFVENYVKPNTSFSLKFFAFVLLKIGLQTSWIKAFRVTRFGIDYFLKEKKHLEELNSNIRLPRSADDGMKGMYHF